MSEGMEHFPCLGNGPRAWPLDEVVIPISVLVGSLPGLSLPICICCSGSVQPPLHWGALIPTPLCLSLSIYLSPYLFICLYHALSWSSLSRECRIFPGVSSLTRIPLKQFFLQECMVKPVSFRGPPCHTTPTSLGKQLPLWVKLDMCLCMCVSV